MNLKFRYIMTVLVSLIAVVCVTVTIANSNLPNHAKKRQNYPDYKIIEVNFPDSFTKTEMLGITESGDIYGWATQAPNENVSFVWSRGRIVSVKRIASVTLEEKQVANHKGDYIELSNNILDQIREEDNHPILHIHDGPEKGVYNIQPADNDRFFNIYAAGINNKDQVVGSMCSWESCHAILWQADNTVDINKIARTDGIELYSADAINDAGWIVCKGKDGTYLLVPKEIRNPQAASL